MLLCDSWNMIKINVYYTFYMTILKWLTKNRKLKNGRHLEKGNGRGFHEKQCISDCTIAVCVYGHLLNVRTIFSKDFFNIILCISYYVSVFLFFFWILIFNYYYIFFVSSFSTSTAFYYLWCAVFFLVFCCRGFRTVWCLPPNFILLLCWVVCCNSVIIKYALNLYLHWTKFHIYIYLFNMFVV